MVGCTGKEGVNGALLARKENTSCALCATTCGQSKPSGRPSGKMSCREVLRNGFV